MYMPWWKDEVCVPCATCVFFAYSLSGTENKPIWTFLHPDVNAPQQVSVEREVSGWDIYELLTRHTVYQEFSQQLSYSLLFNSCKTLLPLFIFLTLWFVAVKQVETPTVIVELNAVRGYGNYSGNWNSGRLSYLSSSFWSCFLHFPHFFSSSLTQNVELKLRKMKLKLR